MKHLTFAIVVCVALIPSAASDAATARRDDVQETGQEGTSSSARRKRSVFHLFNMVTCATSCNPLSYKGYGCYCGFLGSGLVVDGIDKCCKGHDWCYEHASCLGFDHYLAPYRWKCNGGNPYCVATRGPLGGVNSCGHQLCECDREFVECLKQHPCPKTKAICMTSPWRYWQNLFMGLSSGSGMHHADQYSPPPSPVEKDQQSTSSPLPLSPPSQSPSSTEEDKQLSSPPSSSSSPAQDEEYSTVAPPPPSSFSSSSFSHDNKYIPASSPSTPSPLYQDPSPPSPSSQSPPHDTKKSSPTSPPSLYETPEPALSPPHHRLSPHSSHSFQHQHDTSQHPNEAF